VTADGITGAGNHLVGQEKNQGNWSSTRPEVVSSHGPQQPNPPARRRVGVDFFYEWVLDREAIVEATGNRAPSCTACLFTECRSLTALLVLNILQAFREFVKMRSASRDLVVSRIPDFPLPISKHDVHIFCASFTGRVHWRAARSLHFIVNTKQTGSR
jgi:hypothetical protein